MCFSPEASFAGGAVILSIGAATIKQSQKTPVALFAFVPLFFGIQQIAEGFVWLSIQNPEFFFIKKFSTNIFLIMALVIWPVMISTSVFLFEENKKIKKRLKIFVIVGLSISAYFVFCLMFFDIRPEISQYHIRYVNDFPESLRKTAFVFYMIATIIPFFVSSIKKMHFFGGLLIISCLISILFFKEYLTSVWCFFAAFISVVIYLIIRDSNKVYVPEKMQEQTAMHIDINDISQNKHD